MEFIHEVSSLKAKSVLKYLQEILCPAVKKRVNKRYPDLYDKILPLGEHPVTSQHVTGLFLIDIVTVQVKSFLNYSKTFMLLTTKATM